MEWFAHIGYVDWKGWCGKRQEVTLSGCPLLVRSIAVFVDVLHWEVDNMRKTVDTQYHKPELGVETLVYAHVVEPYCGD